MDNDSPSQTPPPAGGTAADSGFFPWLRGLGVTREPGWLGGVAAGVATRLGIDALIVRGIIVVIGILGGPALLLYAVAWLLLPDTTGRIHLQELFRGVFDRALAGIGVLVLLAFVPFSGGWWWFGGWWNDGWIGSSIGAIIWTLLLAASAIWLVVWLANRPRTDVPTAASASHAQATTPSTPAPSSAPAAPGPAALVADPTSEPVAPPAPPKDAADTDLAAWREGQAEWKREHDAWRAQQAASARDAHQQRVAEDRRRRQAEAAERARVARERELRTRPSSAFTLVAIGLALVAGAATALALSEVEISFSTRAATSLAVALAVLSLAIITNGLRGRRSGGSSGVAVLVVIALLFTGVLGWVRGPVISDRDLRWQPTASDESELRTVISGDVTLDLSDYFTDEDARLGTMDLFVVSGDVDVIMPADADGRVEIDAVSGIIRVDDERVDSGGFSSAVTTYDAQSDGDGRMLVDVFVISGNVTVTQAD